jgi:hypothetical protein
MSAATVNVSVCDSAELFVPLALIETVYVPPGVPLAVITVSVELEEPPLVSVTADVLSEQLGGGSALVAMLHASFTAPA